MRKMLLVSLVVITASVAACKKASEPSAPTSNSSVSSAKTIEGTVAFTHGTLFLDETVLIVKDDKLIDKLTSAPKAKVSGKFIKCPPNTIDDANAKCFEVDDIADGSQQTSPAPSTSVTKTGEQKIIFNVKQVETKPYFGEQRCQDMCASKSEDINALLAQGWKVVSSQPQALNVSGNDCICHGSEYIISK